MSIRPVPRYRFLVALVGASLILLAAFATRAAGQVVEDDTGLPQPAVAQPAPDESLPNGQSNGHSNGNSNGNTNGQSNGATNGHANGQAPAGPPALRPANAAASGTLVQVPVPEGRFLPYIPPCSFETPQFTLTSSAGMVGDRIGWYGLGYRSGTRVSVKLYTALNEDLVEQQMIEVDGWCTFMGAFTIRIPDAYYVVVTGLSAKDEQTVIMESVRGVMDMRAPTPVPTRTGPPAAPSGLRAAPVSADMVRLDWNDNSANETSFVIDVDGATGRFTAGVAANASSVTIGTLRPSSRHCFSVAAQNDAGKSAPAATCVVTPREGELGPGR